MLAEIEEAGYAASLSGGSAASPQAPMAPFPSHTPRKRQSAWRSISVDEEAGAVIRPPGVKIDGGGIAKGMLADVVAESLERCEVFAVDCCGDLRLGGRARRARRIRVEDPFGGEPLHELSLQSGALATSGTTRRAWLGPDGRRAHQILDPRSGRPAFTGIAQATAVAPSGLLAEVHAKAALLSGPEGAADWLPFGGVLVHDGGEVEIVAAEQAVPELAATTP
jgi:thiamine biosynthesis lipoprotein